MQERVHNNIGVILQVNRSYKFHRRSHISAIPMTESRKKRCQEYLSAEPVAVLEQRETDSNKVVSKKSKNDLSAKLDKTEWQESEIRMRKKK